MRKINYEWEVKNFYPLAECPRITNVEFRGYAIFESKNSLTSITDVHKTKKIAWRNAYERICDNILSKLS
jgi:hypothetical protein